MKCSPNQWTQISKCMFQIFWVDLINLYSKYDWFSSKLKSTWKWFHRYFAETQIQNNTDSNLEVTSISKSLAIFYHLLEPKQKIWFIYNFFLKKTWSTIYITELRLAMKNPSTPLVKSSSFIIKHTRNDLKSNYYTW